MTSLLYPILVSVALFVGHLCNPSQKDESLKLESRLVEELNGLMSKDEQATNYFSLWQIFKKDHGKKYSTYEEDQQRFLIFVENYQRIHLHNLQYKLGLTSYSMGINRFADMASSEFKKLSTDRKNKSYPKGYQSKKGTQFVAPFDADLPTQIDWREQGYVTPVRDEGQCAADWAFSVAASLEGQLYRKTNKLITLSPQNLLDCSLWGDCDYGMRTFGYSYVEDNGDMDTEEQYPYVAVQGDCNYKNSSNGVKEIDMGHSQLSNETDLAIALATIGPISVAVDGSQDSFRFYQSGIYYEPKCESDYFDLTQSMLLVGYNETETGEKYWIVKNSWGEKWGEHGYIKMAKDMDNNCGIATRGFYPILDHTNPNSSFNLAY